VFKNEAIRSTHENDIITIDSQPETDDQFKIRTVVVWKPV